MFDDSGTGVVVSACLKRFHVLVLYCVAGFWTLDCVQYRRYGVGCCLHHPSQDEALMDTFLIVCNRGWASEVRYTVQSDCPGNAIRKAVTEGWTTPNTVSIEANEVRV